MSPTEAARTVAESLGMPTTHPGTARLARDLADALTRPIDPAPHDPEPFDEMTGPMDCPLMPVRHYTDEQGRDLAYCRTRNWSGVRFQHHPEFQEPVTIHRWEWSDTFGKPTALVTFADGWHGWTYPWPYVK